jgi:hypothetical protein
VFSLGYEVLRVQLVCVVLLLQHTELRTCSLHSAAVCGCSQYAFHTNNLLTSPAAAHSADSCHLFQLRVRRVLLRQHLLAYKVAEATAAVNTPVSMCICSLPLLLLLLLLLLLQRYLSLPQACAAVAAPAGLQTSCSQHAFLAI